MKVDEREKWLLNIDIAETVLSFFIYCIFLIAYVSISSEKSEESVKNAY